MKIVETSARKSDANELYTSDMAGITADIPDPYTHLRAIARPRPVKAKLSARIIMTTLPVCSTLLIYLNLRELRDPVRFTAERSLIGFAWLGLAIAGVMIGVSVLTFWSVLRDSALLRDGELAVGVVTHQRFVKVRGGRGGARTQSRVRYRFKDASGELFQGTGTDSLRRLRVDMTVPVFYKPEDPERNVTLCTSCCDLQAS